MTSPALIGFGALGIAGVAALAAARSVRRTAAWIAPAKHAIAPELRALAFGRVQSLRDVTLHTSDGLTLHGWFSPGTRRAAVILVHGGAGDRMQLFPEALVLASNGYGILMYDSRACGESDGDIVSWGDRERRDVTAALDFVTTQPEIDPQRVALLGFSVGGSTVTLTAAADTRVCAAIVAPVWTSLEDEMRAKAGRFGALAAVPAVAYLRRAGIDVDAVRPIDHVAEIAPRPVLFIAGTGDIDTPVPVMQRMFDAARSPKSLWIVPGATHGSAATTAPAEYESRVIGFLDESLPAPALSPDRR